MPTTLHIFPSTAAVEAFNRQALERSGVLFGTAAITLKRLSEEIFSASPMDRRPISNVGRKLLLEGIIEERYRDGSGCLARLKGFPGFIGTLDGFFGELKQARITAGSFAHTVGRMPHSERLRELAFLFTLYDQALAEKGLMDHHDMELSALSYLEKGGALPPLFDGIEAVQTHAIYDLTPLQLALTAEISRRLPVYLGLPYNPDRPPLYGYVAKTADAMEALDNSDLQLEPQFQEPEGTFLTPLLAALFDDMENGAPVAPPGPMALMAAPGAYRECEEIGRRIRALMAGGIDPAAIAVLFRDLRNYAPMLEDVCRRFGIPVSYRRGVPLFTSPLVRACLLPFAVVHSRFGREELLALCNASYLDIPLGGLSSDAIEEVLVTSRYMDETLGSVEQMVGRRIAALKKGEKPRDKEELAARALSPLLEELRRFKGDKTVPEFILLLTRFIDGHRIYRRGLEAADQRALKRDASAIALFQKVLRDLETDIGTLGLAGKTLTSAEFVALLEQGMEGVFLSGERRSGVSILNFHDARGLRFPHVFMGGLNEGICPQRHDGHPLFKDGDKLLYQRVAGKNLFRTAKDKAEEEPLLFYLATGCAGETLTLSYSSADSRGNELLRSPFLDELLAKIELKETRIPVGRVTPELDACLEREELLNALALKRLFHGTPELHAPLARIAATAEIEARREEFFNGEGAAARAALSNRYTGSLENHDIVAELTAFFESPAGSRFAPTTLEEYGCCPFRYFLKRLLGIFPVERPDMELEAREEGSMVHEVLQAFFQRMQREGRLPLTDVAGAKAIMGQEARRVFAQWEAERYTGNPLLWESEKKKLLPILEGVVEMEGKDDSGFIPHAFEQEFPPLEVEDGDGGRLFLSGKIDRLDIDAVSRRLRVVDYKMAGNGQKYRQLLKKEAMGDTSFQMPVYLLAGARVVEEGSGIAVNSFTALYWLLRKLTPLRKEFGAASGEDFTGFFATDMGERALLGNDNFLNRLCGKVRAMKNGDFQITPKECEFCDFSSVCRYVEVSLTDEE